MPVAGDLLQVKSFQTLTNVPGDILNVYWFRVVSMSTPQSLVNIVDDLTAWWFETFIAPMLAMQSNQVVYQRMEISNADNFEDEFAICTPDFPVAGVFPGEYLAPSTAWSFKLVRTTRLTRNGSKRLAGVPEGLATNNLPSSSARVLADDVRLMWEGQIDVPWGAEDDIMALQMVIPQTNPAGGLPIAYNPVSGVVFRGLGSQNSRKYLNPG